MFCRRLAGHCEEHRECSDSFLSIRTPKRFSCEVRCMVDAIFSSNISQISAVIRQSKAALIFPDVIWKIPEKPEIILKWVATEFCGKYGFTAQKSPLHKQRGFFDRKEGIEENKLCFMDRFMLLSRSWCIRTCRSPGSCSRCRAGGSAGLPCPHLCRGCGPCPDAS